MIYRFVNLSENFIYNLMNPLNFYSEAAGERRALWYKPQGKNL